MRLRRILACIITIAPAIAYAQVDSGPPVPCSAPVAEIVLRDSVTIRAAGALLPLTKGSVGNLTLEHVRQDWNTPRSEVDAEVTTDPTSEPLHVDDLSPPSERSKVSSCSVTIDGRKTTVTTYFERASALLGGPYVATGAYELAPGSWLVIASASRTPAGQQEMVASLRAVRFLPPFGSKERRSPKPCPVIKLQADTSHWQTYSVRSAPVTFKAPSGAHVKKGYAGEAWDAIGTRIDFASLGNGWTIEPLASAATTWCSFSTADGLPGEFAIVHEKIGPQGFDIGIAYIRLSPVRSLSIFAYLYPKPEGPPPVRFRPIPELNEQFRVLVASIRVSK